MASELFTDASFPATKEAVEATWMGGSNMGVRDEWLRPAEVVELAARRSGQEATAPRFWPGQSSAVDAADRDPTATDCIQGHLKNCFFVAACSLVAAVPEKLRALVVRPWSAESGQASFRFWRHEGRWEVVTVDDRLPCGKNDALYFARTPDSNVFWLPLLEKAYAKLYGGYAALVGGNLSECLRDLTGCAVQDFNLHCKQTQQDWIVSGRLLQHMQAASTGGWLMGCANVQSEAPRKRPLPNIGIQYNHAYSVMGVVDVGGGEALVQFRNPWSTDLTGVLARKAGIVNWTKHAKATEWSGAISTAVDSGLLRSAAGLPAARLPEHLKGAAASGGAGVAWMPFAAFVKLFNRLYMATSHMESIAVDAAWAPHTAGGCSSFSSWRMNPVFKLRLPRKLLAAVPTDLQLYLTVSQPDGRTAHSAAVQAGAAASSLSTLSYNAIGLAVVRLHDLSGARLPGKAGEGVHGAATALHAGLVNAKYSVVGKSSFWNKRETSVMLGTAHSSAGAASDPASGDLHSLIPTGADALELLVVPSTYFPGKVGRFRVSLTLLPASEKGAALLAELGAAGKPELTPGPPSTPHAPTEAVAAADSEVANPPPNPSLGRALSEVDRTAPVLAAAGLTLLPMRWDEIYPHAVSTSGAWATKTAGGPPTTGGFFHNNPQFTLKLAEADGAAATKSTSATSPHVLVVLTQHPRLLKRASKRQLAAAPAPAEAASEGDTVFHDSFAGLPGLQADMMKIVRNACLAAPTRDTEAPKLKPAMSVGVVTLSGGHKLQHGDDIASRVVGKVQLINASEALVRLPLQAQSPAAGAAAAPELAADGPSVSLPVVLVPCSAGGAKHGNMGKFTLTVLSTHPVTLEPAQKAAGASASSSALPTQGRAMPFLPDLPSGATTSPQTPSRRSSPLHGTSSTARGRRRRGGVRRTGGRGAGRGSGSGASKPTCTTLPAAGATVAGMADLYAGLE